MSNKRLNIPLIALFIVGTGNEVRADMAADIAASGLSADQVSIIETQSCRAWHARPIKGLRSELIFGTSNLRVSFECEFHDEYQGNRLGLVGMCQGSGTTWSCESAGTLIELSFSSRQRSAVLYDIPLPEGIELMRFLERESGKGRGLAADDLPGTVVQVASVHPSRYRVTVTYVGFDVWIDVAGSCNKRGCKFKLGDKGAYQNFNDLE